jgi:photosystem II stability/assembly factor-like uncharacterized protein
MKKILYTIILLLLINATALYSQQWSQLSSGTTQNLYDVFFINPDTGFVTGNNGMILRTFNGGLTWSGLTTGVNDAFACIMFPDASTGFASGGFAGGDLMNCSLVKTVDGGNTWSDITFAPDKCGGGSYFLDTENGFYAYADTLYGHSSIARTTDGGSTWNTVFTGTGWISYFQFVDAGHGYATVSNGTVLKTTDGGLSWTVMNLPGSLWGSGLFFFDENTGFVGGGPPSVVASIYKTNDGGLTWSSVTAPDMIFKILFTDMTTGYALSVNTSGAGILVKSIDSGATWTTESTPVANLRGMDFINKDLGYAVGDAGAIIKYYKPTGISNELPQNEWFRLYPNPASGEVTIDINDVFTGQTVLKISNLGGQILRTMVLNENHAAIDISGLREGIYLVELNSAGWTKCRKLTIVK